VEKLDGRSAEAYAWPDRTAGHDARLRGDGIAQRARRTTEEQADTILNAVLDAAASCCRRLGARAAVTGSGSMSGITSTPRTKTDVKAEWPRLHKVILVNDDYTPREFVVMVLKAEFRIGEGRAMQVMLTAHRRGVCVVAVYTKDVADTKAANATDAGRRKGYPLLFTTEPEE